MAKNPEQIKAARHISPTQWVALGHDNYSLWGKLPHNQNAMLETSVDLLRMQRTRHLASATFCTCGTKRACPHVLSLLFLAVEKPQEFKLSAAPEYVRERYDTTARQARKQMDRNGHSKKHYTADLTARLLSERRARIADGIRELDSWLRNLIACGLSDPQIKSYKFWDEKLQHMHDAQAPELAHRIDVLSSIAVRGRGTEEALLIELGKLHLLIEVFKRFDLQTPGVQGDIRTALGWHQKQEEIPEQCGIRDQWFVIGKEETTQDDWLHAQRVWLRGESTGYDALLLDMLTGDQLFETSYSPGQILDAELVYFDSAYSLRAFLSQVHHVSSEEHTVAGKSIIQNLDAYSHALSANIWLTVFPMVIENVLPSRYNGQWVLRDLDNYHLPLSTNFEHKWVLLALSGDHPITISGTWDGCGFMPLGAFVPYQRGSYSERKQGIRFVDLTQIGVIS